VKKFGRRLSRVLDVTRARRPGAYSEGAQSLDLVAGLPVVDMSAIPCQQTPMAVQNPRIFAKLREPCRWRRSSSRRRRRVGPAHREMRVNAVNDEFGPNSSGCRGPELAQRGRCGTKQLPGVHRRRAELCRRCRTGGGDRHGRWRRCDNRACEDRHQPETIDGLGQIRAPSPP